MPIKIKTWEPLPDDWKMGSPSMAGDLIAERDRLRREVQTLVDALKLMPEITYKSIIEGAGVEVEKLPNELQCICDAALVKVVK